MKKSVVISGHSTSVSLEPEFWKVLGHIAYEQDLSVPGVIRQVDQNLPVSRKRNLSSALRIHMLRYLLEKSGLANIISGK